MKEAITENLTISFDLKMLALVLSLAAIAIWGYRDLKDGIEKAKELPIPGTGTYMVDENDANAKKTWPANRIEYTMKDQATRNAIKQLEARIIYLEGELEELKDQ